MILGILQFDVHIHDSQSLKDKRRVVLSLKDRLHREHMVAIAEVSHQETLNLARLGLAMVGSDGKHVGQTLDRIVAKLRSILGASGEAELGDVSRQVLQASQIEWEEDTTQATATDNDQLAAELIARASELEADVRAQAMNISATGGTRHGAHRQTPTDIAEKRS